MDGESLTTEAAWLRAGYIAALGVACPACAQQPGEVCLDFHDSADPAKYTKLPEPHEERVEVAAYLAAGEGGSPIHTATAAQIRTAAEGVV